MKVEFIVIHTAAADWPGVTVDEIRRWHRRRGFSDIGYHFVIDDDGVVHPGRRENIPGAHALGMNHRSLGICVTGHGDVHDFYAAQIDALGSLLRTLCKTYHLTPDRILGHREVGEIPGCPAPHKTCPGEFVNMDRIRALAIG